MRGSRAGGGILRIMPKKDKTSVSTSNKADLAATTTTTSSFNTNQQTISTSLIRSFLSSNNSSISQTSSVLTSNLSEVTPSRLNQLDEQSTENIEASVNFKQSLSKLAMNSNVLNKQTSNQVITMYHRINENEYTSKPSSNTSIRSDKNSLKKENIDIHNLLKKYKKNRMNMIGNSKLSKFVSTGNLIAKENIDFFKMRSRLQEQHQQLILNQNLNLNSNIFEQSTNITMTQASTEKLIQKETMTSQRDSEIKNVKEETVKESHQAINSTHTNANNATSSRFVNLVNQRINYQIAN